MQQARKLKAITNGHQSTRKLTTYEWNGLTSTFNLADGHPRQSLLPAQQAILQDMPALFLQAHRGHEVQAKQRFEQAFFHLAGQQSVHRMNPPLSQYSGSMAIELLVNYLRLHKKSVAFLHPSFDSLADTMRRHGIPLIPLDEDTLCSLTVSSPRLPVDAVYIVCPNNPTGRTLTQQQFRNLVAYCKRHKLLLVIDFCFRFYGSFWDYDQYEILQSSGIDFITTEDTGKTWPTADIKLSMVVASHSIYPELKSISNDFLLCVSPVVFALLTEFIKLEKPHRRRVWSQTIANKNRKKLRGLLAKSPIEVAGDTTTMSVEWLSLPKGWKAAGFVDDLAAKGIQVLPGNQFYWHNHASGDRFFRVALLRDATYFQKAIIRLAQLANTYQP